MSLDMEPFGSPSPIAPILLQYLARNLQYRGADLTVSAKTKF
jgi:hypothetical protein